MLPGEKQKAGGLSFFCMPSHGTSGSPSKNVGGTRTDLKPLLVIA